jgi:dTDP-4-amino-4,6-dideoxygalactose transaminase
MKHIPLLVPEVPNVDEILPYLRRIDHNKIYSNFGPLNSELTERLSRHFGIRPEQTVTLSNATLALQGAVTTSPSASREWEAPAWTFTATVAGILNAGRVPILSDVDSDWRVDYRGRSRNLLDVLPFGGRPDFGRLPLGDMDCLLVDGAASFDALANVEIPNGLPVGIVVSMHATKSLAAGEGGVFISNDSTWVKRVRNWANFGMESERVSNSLGTNAKLSEYAAAVGLATLDNWQEIRHEFMRVSHCVLEICKKFELSTIAPNFEFVSPYWIIKNMNPSTKKNLYSVLDSEDIQWRDWWERGCHRMPAYSVYREEGFEYVNTDIAYATSIGLPFFARLSQEKLDRISSALEYVFAHKASNVIQKIQ